ncbi:hypothetical protein RHMOL_Rhmol01G0149000 [Rhododendron molle]|uniref:Uncharacterized protein n=1 Tax=Rhododendron molle TaxID=49168 RepID=A0ACC0Q2Z7_RHOML|nr:hypothetical protein RHMOL_Rhmol01G0149000 [Rhododendron molle]
MSQNEGVIKQVFVSRDVEHILGIPISATGVQDKRIWARSSNEKFSMKSAYVIAKENGQRINNEAQGQQVSGVCDDGK